MPRPGQSEAELRELVVRYQDDVLSGRRVVGRLERLAVERHARDLASVASGERADLRFDESKAVYPLVFATRFCRHTKGRQWAKQRFTFNSRSAWSAWALFVLFGWEQQHSDGHWERRFNEAFLSMARKNGKTMIAAIIALYMFFGQSEPAAEVYFGATELSQAAIGWKQAVGMVKLEPAFDRAVSVTAGTKGPFAMKRLDDFESTFMALSRNDHNFDGFNPYCVLLDEIHAHPDSGMYDVMRSGQGARISPMRVLITTRGANPESFCGAHERAMISVLEGTAADDSAFVFIATLDEDDDWKDPHVWAKANPNIGVTVTIDGLQKELQSALADPTKVPEFKRKRVNLWTVGVKSWLTLEQWDACAGKVDDDLLTRAPCAIGVDLSKSDDFTAACLVWRVGEQLVARWAFWLPADAAPDRATRSRIPLDSWVGRGLVTLTPGPIVDQDFVKAWIKSQCERYDVREVAFDPAQSWKLCAELEAEGTRGVLHFPQQWAQMHNATKETEDAVLTGRFVHDRNPVARWMFRNVVIRENATGLHRIDKGKSPDKVDGMTALVMALSRAQLALDPGSVYETRGLLTT